MKKNEGLDCFEMVEGSEWLDSMGWVDGLRLDAIGVLDSVKALRYEDGRWFGVSGRFGGDIYGTWLNDLGSDDDGNGVDDDGTRVPYDGGNGVSDDDVFDNTLKSAFAPAINKDFECITYN